MSEIIQARSNAGKHQDNLPSCPRYFLNFTYHMSKDHHRYQAKSTDPFRLEQSITLKRHISKEINPQIRASYFDFKNARSTSFQPASKCLSNNPYSHEQNGQESFSRHGFPQRKKKTGDQQLLKLLLKCADKLADSSRYQKELRKLHGPLFDENVQTHQKIIPRLKYRTRFNWNKGHENPGRTSQMLSERRSILNGFPSGKLS